MASLIPLAITFVLMWVLLIRPQQQRVRRHQALVASLGVGDRIVTAGGLLGRLTALDEETVSVEVAPGVTVKLLRAAVSQRVDDEATAPEALPSAGDGLPREEDTA